MKELSTKYGIIKGIVSVQYYRTGEVESCVVEKRNELVTSYGKLIPQYEDDGVRRKYTSSLSFYRDGALKSISLQQAMIINTQVGPILVEHVILYPSGNVKRVFPLNGKITGYWTEEDEYGLAQEYTFNFPLGEIRIKPIGVYFYDGGGVKSITIWPKERLRIGSPIGPVEVRYGMSFYANGQLQSCEPANPTPVKTPIGTMAAYDTTAIGVNADQNSLSFTTAGSIQSLVTSLNQVEVTTKDGVVHVFAPDMIPSLFNPDKMDTLPLHVQFYEDKVCFGKSEEFLIEDITCKVGPFVNKANALCSDCSNCTACG